MTTTIIRLKNTGKGQPYGIERAEDLDGETAAQQTEVWGESAGTIAMCVVIDGEEDSRYEKQYLDESRVPEGWVAKQAKKKDMPKAAIPVAPPSRPLPPPTLVNPEPKAAEKRAACADCYRTGKPRDEAPEGNVRHCTACLIPFTCVRCLRPLPITAHEGDDDPTPSGRLNNRRCPSCGAKSGLSGRDTWRMYTGRQ